MANGRKLASHAPSTRAANPLHAICMPTPTTTAASVRPTGERDRHQIGEAQAAQAASAAHPTQQRKSPQSLSSRANAQAMHKAEQASTSLAKEIVGGTEPGQRGASALRQGLACTTPATSTADPAPPTASAPGKHPGKVTSATQQVAGGLVKGRREERREQRAASAAARPARIAAAVGGTAGGDGSAPLPRSAFKRGDTVETIVAL
jgi:hypothetical protein